MYFDIDFFNKNVSFSFHKQFSMKLFFLASSIFFKKGNKQIKIDYN